MTNKVILIDLSGQAAPILTGEADYLTEVEKKMSETDTSVTEVTKNMISGNLPEGWKLLELGDYSRNGEVRLRASMKTPMSVERKNDVYGPAELEVVNAWKDGKKVIGIGTVEQILDSVELLHAQLEKEAKAHLEANNIIASDEAVREYIKEQQIATEKAKREAAEKAKKEAAEKAEREETNRVAHEARKVLDEERKKIKATYTPYWLSDAYKAIDMPGKREAEKKRFLEKWAITEEQFSACSGATDNRVAAPYIFLKFEVAGVTVTNQREYPFAAMGEYYSAPTFSDKDEALAEALSKSLGGKKVYLEETDEDTALAVRVESDYIYINRKGQIEEDNY